MDEKKIESWIGHYESLQRAAGWRSEELSWRDDKMTKTAGKIGKEWIEDCAINETEGSTVLDWIRTALNDNQAEIDDEGSVWSLGSWLTQEDCDELVAQIDAGI